MNDKKWKGTRRQMVGHVWIFFRKWRSASVSASPCTSISSINMSKKTISLNHDTILFSVWCHCEKCDMLCESDDARIYKLSEV